MQTINEKIATAEKELEQSQNRLKVLENKYSDAVRRARAHRLIERGAILESCLPGLEEVPNTIIKEILERCIDKRDVRAILWTHGYDWQKS